VNIFVHIYFSVSGWIEDLTGSWDNVFYVSGILQLLAAVITFVVSRCSQHLVTEGDVETEKDIKDAVNENLLDNSKQ
jgi:hypothetical protein